MNDEKAKNLGYFDENINNGKEFNFIYKKSYEKEDHIITGECILNYLLENQYTKPFIKENYMMKADDNSYFQKLNIFNYKTKFREYLNNNKNKPITVENNTIKRVLDILHRKNEQKNTRKFRFLRLNINNDEIKGNKPMYLNTEGNKENKNSFFEKYLLPKIDFKKDNKRKLNEDNKNNFELNKGIFKNTSINKSSDIEENNSLREKIFNKPLNYYSPCLKKNIFPLFRNINGRHSISVKKGKLINEELSKISDNKFNINSFTSKRNSKNKYEDIKKVKITNRKYHLINLFKDIGKIKSPREIEQTLFTQIDEDYKRLKSKKNLFNIKK